jgi:ABC-type transporter Mla MlaB component
VDRLRTFRLGDDTHVIVFRGELDDRVAATLAAEIARGRLDGRVVVDLLGVVAVDDRALVALLPWLRLDNVAVVADRRLHDVWVLPSLAEALA